MSTVHVLAAALLVAVCGCSPSHADQAKAPPVPPIRPHAAHHRPYKEASSNCGRLSRLMNDGIADRDKVLDRMAKAGCI